MKLSIAEKNNLKRKTQTKEGLINYCEEKNLQRFILRLKDEDWYCSNPNFKL